MIVGALIGAFHGWLSATWAFPAFIVTLGGLLIWRNVGWYITNGQTIGPLDPTFQISAASGHAGGPVVDRRRTRDGRAMCGAVRRRRNKMAHGQVLKPLWAELTMSGIIDRRHLRFRRDPERLPGARACAGARFRGPGRGHAGGLHRRLRPADLGAAARGHRHRDDGRGPRTRLGRYIFATGGNPDAAALSGINTRLLTVKVFAIMGVLCALSAVVASARLSFHSNDIGTLDELRVIAAAVIGGTALSGGLGTIHGAILGALIMQSLQSGMAMVGVDAPFQNIVVGAVLDLAVLIDIIYRKRTGAV